MNKNYLAIDLGAKQKAYSVGKKAGAADRQGIAASRMRCRKKNIV
jgi:hypothetical protein